METYEIYEAAVQDAPQEARFLARLYRGLRKREARRLREDFCGTFWLGAEWLRLDPRNRALGVDLDLRAMRSGWRRHGLDAARAAHFHGNVLGAPNFRADLIFAGNFSYFGFRERADLLKYFRGARRGLAKGGLFVLDHFGGADIHEPSLEKSRRRNHNGTRVEVEWEQLDFDEIHHRARFRLRARTKPRGPWTTLGRYDWRLWTLPELRDLLSEAGFRRVHIYWQDDHGDFRPRKRSEEGCLKWLAYIVAEA